jgi:hypothetical protein
MATVFETRNAPGDAAKARRVSNKTSFRPSTSAPGGNWGRQVSGPLRCSLFSVNQMFMLYCQSLMARCQPSANGNAFSLRAAANQATLIS